MDKDTKITAEVQLIAKIQKTADFEPEKTLLLFKEIGDLKTQGFITKEQGIKILKWKSPRPLKYFEINSEDDFICFSKLAFDAKDEKLRIHILTALSGVNYPSASAILMFYDRTQYPIIDIRVWKQLFKAGLVITNSEGKGFSLKEWVIYLNVIRDIASKINLTPRQVEKRLFDIDQAEQEGNLYK